MKRRTTSAVPTVSALVDGSGPPGAAAESRRPKRLINKDGSSNVAIANVHAHCWEYCRDTWTSLLEMAWVCKLLLFLSLTLGIVGLFGLLWYALALHHGDLTRPPTDAEAGAAAPCVINIVSFGSAFLFSLETHATIGFGVRRVTDACPAAALLLTLQMLVSAATDALVAGVILARLARPSRRAGTVRFASRALVVRPPNSERGASGAPRLLVRVADARPCCLVGCSVSGRLLRVSPASGADGGCGDGRFVTLAQRGVEFTVDRGGRQPFLTLPATLTHVLDGRSPLHGLTEGGLPDGQPFEIIVALTGVADSTGAVCQARTSYLPSEILWDHTFSPTMSLLAQGGFRVDLTQFDKVLPLPHFQV
ncbi:unnamed protein product [Lampetra planeri]